jgi:hypothetical protein
MSSDFDEYKTENEIFLELSLKMRDIILSLLENNIAPIIP